MLRRSDFMMWRGLVSGYQGSELGRLAENNHRIVQVSFVFKACQQAHSRTISLLAQRGSRTKEKASGYVQIESSLTGGRRIMVVPQLPKLETRVRFPSPAPSLLACGARILCLE